MARRNILRWHGLCGGSMEIVCLSLTSKKCRMIVIDDEHPAWPEKSFDWQEVVR